LKSKKATSKCVNNYDIKCPTNFNGYYSKILKCACSYISCGVVYKGQLSFNAYYFHDQ